MAPRKNAKASKLLILTIGHSTRSIAEFLGLLRANGVELLVDIRTIPRSRHNPQFDEDALAKSLKAAGIGYLHLKELGGLRRAAKDSPNGGWRNASFRGFADYMQTPEFEAGIAKLIELAGTAQVAIMCAEAVPWRCHRSLVSDALLVRGVRAEHIMGPAARRVHELTPFAKVDGTKIAYPGG
ncbi:Uncharacterised protein [Candidatus Burarchaeum australiense]|nr:Uncharacterised protein [Candidatus Burarchaeum australiense]